MLLLSGMSTSQTLTFDMNGLLQNVDDQLENGKYLLTIVGEFDIAKYRVNYKRDNSTIPIEPINPSYIEDKVQDSTESFINDFSFERLDTLRIKNRTKIEIVLEVVDISKDSVIQSNKLTYRGKNNKAWFTSIGIGSTIFTNRDTYRSSEVEGLNGYEVVRDGSKNQMDVSLVLQFTFLNTERDSGLGISGGVGYDTSNLSAYLGPTVYLGQAVFITAGIALQKQKRLNSLYSLGQQTAEKIEYDELNKEYYRFNPFISITYRLSKNIFGGE